MSYRTSNVTETDEIEFTAAYGTAVAMMGKRQRTIPNHQAETLERSSGSVTGRLNVATGTDQHLCGPHSAQPDDKAVDPAQLPARRSIRLAAAPDAGKSRRNRPQPRSDMNRGRKAA